MCRLRELRDFTLFKLGCSVNHMPSAVGGATGGAAVQAVAGARVKMRLAVLISGQLVRLHDAQFDAIASLPTAHVHLVLPKTRACAFVRCTTHAVRSCCARVGCCPCVRWRQTHERGRESSLGGSVPYCEVLTGEPCPVCRFR